MTTRTRAGLRKVRALGPGDRVAIVAPASPLKQDDEAQCAAGVAELMRLGLKTVYDDRVLDRTGYVAGATAARAAELKRALSRDDITAIIALRGGYGSVQLLPRLVAADVPDRPAGIVGYSDITSLHIFLAFVAGVTSVHGVMIDGRLAKGVGAYDERSFWGSLGAAPLGELAPDGVEILREGEAAGPLFGGTLTQILGSLATPYAFDPPAGYVLFVDEVGERPYRIDRMFVQLQQSGLLARASAVVCGELPRCDEPDGAFTAREVVSTALSDFPGPVLFGFPSGHTTRLQISLPFGVHARVIARAGAPRLVIDEAAAI